MWMLIRLLTFPQAAISTSLLLAQERSAEADALQHDLDGVLSKNEALESHTGILRQRLRQQEDDEHRSEEAHAAQVGNLRLRLASTQVRILLIFKHFVYRLLI